MFAAVPRTIRGYGTRSHPHAGLEIQPNAGLVADSPRKCGAPPKTYRAFHLSNLNSGCRQIPAESTFRCFSFFTSRIIRAGLPATIAFGGTLLVTILPAPT